MNRPAIEQAPDIFSESTQLFSEWITKGPRLFLQVAGAIRDDARMQRSSQNYLSRAFARMCSQMMSNPAHLGRAQLDLWWEGLSLWTKTVRRATGQPIDEAEEEGRPDRRFRHPAWNELAFDFLKQSYLLISSWMRETIAGVDGLDAETRELVDFYTKQYVDALSPSNFMLTNPEVLKATIETMGGNLVRGMRNLLSDLERGEGRLRIRRTDLDAFTVGENLATTPGKVVFQTDLMQLIQYEPTTDKVHKKPLMIIPPWINKYYILDLREKNSFVRWAVQQGFTVFMVSWVDPDEKLAHKGFEDYLLEGPMAALDAIEKATGEKQVSAIGYCLGGTLLAAGLARMAKIGDDRITSATFFTTLVDFEDPGEIGVFVDDCQLTFLEREMKAKGYLEDYKMQIAFNMLRANDLIWSYVVNNYLLGREPFPFDLLYWNADGTRMPATMHSFYLRNMYLDNKLACPNALTIAGEPIDLRAIKLPTYVLSCRDDHIAPWRSTYAATQLYGGKTRMVLAGSGHIAGVVNPPTQVKYGYWTNDKLPPDPEDWFEGATPHEGSWWVDWGKWNAEQSGELVPARKAGSDALPPIEDAPGSYVV
jgi:polyhydroxyalkanoate synthase